VNILHVSSTDLVGGRFTGYYMHKVADSAEHRFTMAVWDRESDSPSVCQLRPARSSILRKPRSALRLLDRALGLEGLTGLGSFVYPFRRFFKQADVVHLQLIHNSAFFSILALPALTRTKPLVWTIHDCWAFTGMCTHPFNCNRWLSGCRGRCPHPRGHSPLRYYIPAVHWRTKRVLYKRTRLTLVAASRWVQERVQSSPLLGHLPCHLIPFGIDLEEFSPRPKAEALESLGIKGIHPDEHVLAFRGVGIPADQYKGMVWLREALELYEPTAPTTLLIMQDGSSFAHLSRKYRIVNLGWVDGSTLVNALCAADLFLMPSVQEAFGVMAIEAMACGTPVVVFEGTALPDVIRAPRGGVAVPARDSAALEAAIRALLADEGIRSGLARQARELAEQEYSLETYVRRHLALYESLAGEDAGR